MKLSPQQQVSRRSFLKSGLIITAAAPVIGSLIVPARAEDAATLPALDPTSAQAAALGYVHDATKVDLVKWSKKAAPDGHKQKCSNCVLFREPGVKVEGQEGQWGKCGLFPTHAVNSQGWCNSWALHPNPPA